MPPAARRRPAIAAATDAHSWATLLGLAIVGGLGALDVHWGSDKIISATVVIAPFITALAGSTRQTAVVAVAALVVCTVSGSWNHNYGTDDYVVRVLVVAAGGVFALVGARTRERLAIDRVRFRMLAGVAAITEAGASVAETVQQLNELLVPAIADAAVLDVVRGGLPQRLAVMVDGPRRAELESALREGTPTAEEHDPEPGWLRSHGVRSSIVVPLRARARRIGTMTLLLTRGSRPRYGADDVEFAKVLSGRVALALDNAGLFAELETLEAQQAAALGSLAEAVTIQDRHGTLVYANDTAARMLGFPSADTLLATPTDRVVDAFDAFHEDGSPLDIERLPGRRALAGEEPEPVLIRAIHRLTGEERWRLTKATAVRDGDGRPRLAVNIIEDVTDARRAELRDRFLAEAGAVLASSLDYEETLNRVAQLAVPALADWCGVSMPDDRGYLRSVAVAHVDPAKVAFAREYNERYPTRMDSPTGAPQVMRDMRSQVVNEIPDELLEQSIPDAEQLAAVRAIGMRSGLVVPMVSAGTAIGAITLVNAESRRTFSQADLELAEELGRRAGAVVESARLYTERSQIAATLQSSLLPAELPAIPGYALASLYRPAGAENWVGGDFFDAVETARGWMITVGDVAGHGAEAAALTARARYTMRTGARLLGDPVAAIAELNQALGGGERLSVCTVVAVLLEERAEAPRASVVCAGHPLPLLVRGGTVSPVGRWGVMVGAWEDAAWEAAPVGLEAGDMLVIYTDGVTDARGAEGRFGEARLRAAVAPAADPRDAVARIGAALDAFETGSQADDTAVLAVMRTGHGTP